MGSHRLDNRRRDERVPLDMFFTQYIRERPFRVLAVNVSENGIAARRLVEPLTTHARVVGIEFELPGTSEVIWAKAETQFEAIDRDFHHLGIRFLAMAGRHERLLRDYVRERQLRASAWWRHHVRVAFAS